MSLRLTGLRDNAAGYCRQLTFWGVSSTGACVRRISGHVPVHFVLDYHLSAQFAGLIVAKEQGVYAQRGLSVELLNPPSAGEEPQLVQAMQVDHGKDVLILGSAEQNTLCTARVYGDIPIRGVAAMLHATPLAIATAPSNGISSLSDLAGKTIAAASDTEEIVRSALAHADPTLPASVTILPVPREDKLRLFLAGDVDAFQVYSTTEALELRQELATEPLLMPFGADHGYAQVIFTVESSLADVQQRRVARAFLDATFEGWKRAVDNPAAAAESVVRARRAA